MDDKVRLRVRRTHEDILGTVEREEFYLPFYDIERRITAKGLQLELCDYGALEPAGEGSETLTDNRGRRLLAYRDETGALTEIPEDQVEPFVDGMSQRGFTHLPLHIHILCEGDPVDGAHDLLSSLAADVVKSVSMLRAGTGTVHHGSPRKINATEAALLLGDVCAALQLDSCGRDLPEEEEPPPEVPACSVWEENPDWPVDDWRSEVANDETRLGYVEWCEAQDEHRQHEEDTDP